MNGVELRPITADDVEFARVMRNANRNSFIDNREVSPEQQQLWFAALRQKLNVDFRIIWLNGVRIGTVSSTDHPDGSREIGNATIANDYRRRGIATFAESALANPQVRCWGSYLVDNPAAATVMRRAGFEPIPIRRDMQHEHCHGQQPTADRG